MKKNLDISVLTFLTIVALIFWWQALFNFFAQDDFILINNFSKNSFWQDFKNVFGPPVVTHWRPLHNLYFLVAGNLFDKNYFGYHTIILGLHIGTSFLIYKTIRILSKSHKSAMAASFLYAVHPANFISLYWPAGSATIIGFFFLIASFYSYLTKKKNSSLILFTLAILASEAMAIGLAIFLTYELLFEKMKSNRNFLAKLAVISLVFLIVRLLLLTPKTTFDSYQVELSTKTFLAIKYYLLRIAGFAEASGDEIASIALLLWLLLIGWFLLRAISKEKMLQKVWLPMSIVISGLFPFILIPTHLSPHYMNVAIFGLTALMAMALKQVRPIVLLIILLSFAAIAIYNINITRNNNWLIIRSNLAKTLLTKIEKENPPAGTILIFADSQFFTSQEAYFALGTAEAIKFWFRDKNYETCFTAFEICQ